MAMSAIVFMNTPISTLRKSGWDGYNAKPLTFSAASKARSLLIMLMGGDRFEGMSIVPCGDGVIQFEWHRGQKSLEFEMAKGNQINYLKWDPAHGVEDEGFVEQSDTNALIEMIDWFKQRESTPAP